MFTNEYYLFYESVTLILVLPTCHNANRLDLQHFEQQSNYLFDQDKNTNRNHLLKPPCTK